jgi:molecular chaperone GrpE
MLFHIDLTSFYNVTELANLLFKSSPFKWGFTLKSGAFFPGKKVACSPPIVYFVGDAMDKDKNFSESADKDAPKQRGAGASVEDLPAGGETPLPEPHQLTPEDIEELKAEAAKAKEHWDQLLRTAADFENFRKRAARERQELSKYANESLLQRLLPVLENLEAALSTASGGQPVTLESLQTGLKMIQQQFKSVLTEAGLEEIDAANKPFDPNWHEAIAQQEAPNVPEGQVVQQVRKGYKLRDRLLRPASVVVSKAPSKKSPA